MSSTKVRATSAITSDSARRPLRPNERRSAAQRSTAINDTDERHRGHAPVDADFLRRAENRRVAPRVFARGAAASNPNPPPDPATMELSVNAGAIN